MSLRLVDSLLPYTQCKRMPHVNVDKRILKLVYAYINSTLIIFFVCIHVLISPSRCVPSPFHQWFLFYSEPPILILTVHPSYICEIDVKA